MILLLVQEQPQVQFRLHQQTTLLYEANETAIIAVTGVSGGSATESGTQSQTITITDDDTSSFSVADVTVAEGAGTATITVSASNAVFE